MQHPLYRVLTELQLTRFVYSIDINNEPCRIRWGCIFYVNYYLGQNSLICSCQRIGRYILHKAFNICLYLSKEAHPARADPRFLSFKWSKVFLFPQPMARLPSSFYWASLMLQWFPFILLRERSSVRVKCFTQEHNTLTQSGVKSASLNQKSSALIFRLPLLPLKHQWMMILLTMFVVKAM